MWYCPLNKKLYFLNLTFTFNLTSTSQVELTPEQKALFPELTDLRQQIENLQVK